MVRNTQQNAAPTQERFTTPPGSTSPALFEQQHSKMSTHMTRSLSTDMTETGNMLNVRKPKKEVLITSVSNNAGKQNKNSVSRSHVKIGTPPPPKKKKKNRSVYLITPVKTKTNAKFFDGQMKNAEYENGIPNFDSPVEKHKRKLKFLFHFPITFSTCDSSSVRNCAVRRPETFTLPRKKKV